LFEIAAGKGSGAASNKGAPLFGRGPYGLERLGRRWGIRRRIYPRIACRSQGENNRWTTGKPTARAAFFAIETPVEKEKKGVRGLETRGERGLEEQREEKRCCRMGTWAKLTFATARRSPAKNKQKKSRRE